MFRVLSIMEREIFCNVIWVIWWEHNRLVHGEKGRSLKQLIETSQLQSKSGLPVSNSGSVSKERPRDQTRKPPVEDFVKLNVDTSVFKKKM